MDSMDYFLNTLAVVFGILSPVIVVFFLLIIVQAFKTLPHAMEIKADELRKRPPFTDVEVNVNPATNVMTVRMIKDDEVIWEGASSRRQMEDNGILTFTPKEES